MLDLYQPGKNIVTSQGSSTFTQRHTLAWDLVTDAIDSGAFRRRFEKGASQAARTPAYIPGLENVHVALVEKSIPTCSIVISQVSQSRSLQTGCRLDRLVDVARPEFRIWDSSPSVYPNIILDVTAEFKVTRYWRGN